MRVQAGASSGLLPTLDIALSGTSISSAAPATVTATLRDAKNAAVAGQVITFAVARGLAVTNVSTALTRDDGTAVVILSPASSTSAGADEVIATATVAGSPLSASSGFTVQATNVTISSFTSAVPSLGAYGQTSLTVGLTGASVGSPVQVTVSSACVIAGKATLSPAKFTATAASVTLQYRDIGCGAVQAADALQAVIDGSASTASLALPIASPAVSSLAFISSTPQQIFLKGSGFTESSSVIFEVRDANSSPLPNVNVAMRLLTLTGGVTMDGGTADVVRASDAQGRVTVRVNSGTLPTPVRVAASLQNDPTYRHRLQQPQRRRGPALAAQLLALAGHEEYRGLQHRRHAQYLPDHRRRPQRQPGARRHFDQLRHRRRPGRSHQADADRQRHRADHGRFRLVGAAARGRTGDDHFLRFG